MIKNILIIGMLMPFVLLHATDFTTGTRLPFTLVNPPNTRNIIGNYAIAGNTVLCLTEKTTGYGGTCQGDNSTSLYLTSNIRVVKYLDVDSNSGTWNSTSSYILMANTYDEQQGIVWAGLFWQGRVAFDKYYYIRYAIPDGDLSFTTVEVGGGTSVSSIDVAAAGATNIKLKIDSGAYNDVQADTFHTYSASNGQTYAAYADVTSFLRSASLTGGMHNFTVANLLTMEGREASPGAYGGWSIVVVYGENFLLAKPKNISIYNGFISIGPYDDPIAISGFKLPKGGPVNAQLSIFSGEGEYSYGTNAYTSYYQDWIKLSDNESTGYVFPGGCTSGNALGNCNNIFDAHLTGILRENIAGKFNDQLINNTGIDIDTFDVSDIMEGYRNANPDINTTYIKTYSNNDYVTPSMIAFSAELYKPSICYDYTILKDGFDITGNDREINSAGSGDLSINIALQSEDGDFDFTSSTLGVRLIPTTDTTFVDALYAPNNVNTMVPAIYSTSHSPLNPKIAIGEDISPAGGTIKRLQRYFAKFNYHMDTNNYDGRFEVELNSTVNYGSGAVPIIQSTENNSIPRCPQSDYYEPLQGSFNIERHGSSGAPDLKYPLYTQVVGKDFDFDVVAYQAPLYDTELSLDKYTVDIELINVRPFHDANSTFVCNNPQPEIIQTLNASGDRHSFATFQGSSRVDMGSLDIQTDTALRNAAFRIWYIVDKNNSIVPYTSNDPSDNSYFQGIYDTFLKADDTTLQASGTHGFCTVETLGGGGCSSYANPELGTSGCYACMRDFFSKAVCSRDNFAIRPAAYRISISDSNESATPSSTIHLESNNVVEDTPPVRVAAGYLYKLDGNATSYVGDQTIARGYTRAFDNTETDDLSSLLQFRDQGVCYDQNATQWDISFANGVITGTIENNGTDLSTGSLVKHSNVGKYAYSIHDSNWTIVDQQRYQYKTFAGVDDCIIGDNSIATDSISKSGCDIDSKLVANTGFNGSPVYSDLPLQYEPYRFDLSGINLNIRPDNDSRYLFMTDLNDPYYQTDESIGLTMAAVHEGNLTAMSKDGRVTTNFTDSCAAEEVSLHITRLTTPAEANLSIAMQQTLVYGSNPLKTTYDDNQTDPDANLSLATAGFEDQAPYGSAHVRIYSTFQKPDKEKLDDNGTEGINPINANYIDLRAYSIDANVSAHMTVHIPRGIVAQDRNVTFLYGRVVPAKKLYSVTEDAVDTTLMVTVYCDSTDGSCSDNNLNSTATAEDLGGNWYLAAALFDNPDLMFGDTILDINYLEEKVTTIIMEDRGQGNANTDTTDNPPELTGRHFERTALKQELNIAMNDPSQSNRPTRTRIGIYPPVWLRFDPNTAPHGSKTDTQLGNMTNYFDVRFIPRPTGWTGHGKTGYIVGDPDNGDDINTLKTKRLEW